MKQDEAKAIFTLAGIPVLAMKALIDGYGYNPEDSRFTETPPRCAWWFVKTPVGWIEIGWRKRVISINWSDTNLRKIVTEDDVTKDMDMVHAYSTADAVKYLSELAVLMK